MSLLTMPPSTGKVGTNTTSAMKLSCAAGGQPERAAIQKATAIAPVDSATLASRKPSTSAASEAGTCASIASSQ